MGFKLPEWFQEHQKEIYDKKYIQYDDKEIHVSELDNRSVTWEMKQQMSMNSYAQDDMPQKLTNEALIEVAEMYLSNCSKPRFPCTTYDEALIHKILPELLVRLKEKLN